MRTRQGTTNAEKYHVANKARNHLKSAIRNWLNGIGQVPFGTMLWEAHKRERGLLRRIAAKVGVPHWNVEDVIQAALVEAWKRRADFTGADGLRHLRRWLRTVVHNRAVDAVRRREHRACQPLDVGQAEPIDKAERKRTEMRELRECLAVLLERSQAINQNSHRLMYAHYLEGQSILELAEEEGTTEDAINGRIRRHLKQLRPVARRLLEGTHPEDVRRAVKKNEKK